MKLLANNSKHWLLDISILLGLFLPHSNFVFQIIHSLLPLFLYVVYYKYIGFPGKFKSNIVFVVIILFSFSINAIAGNNIELKDVARLFSFLILFSLFPFIHSVKISNLILYVSLLFIFLSQIAYVLNISLLVSFFDRFYPYSGEVRGFSSEFLLQSSRDIESIVHRRYGGLYHNPNQAVRFVTLLLSVFLLENRRNSIKIILPYLIISFSSLILAGSRTGIVVGGILIIMCFIYLQKGSLKIKKSFYLILFIFLVYYGINLIFGQSDLRVFQISSGVEGSLGTKIDWFFDFFWKLQSPLNFLVGHFSTSNMYDLYRVSLLDSEWGELFYSFGIFGSFSLLMFYLKLFSTKDKNIRFYLIILLWCISSTVIFSFRMSFLFMLFLSKYYSDYLTNKKIIK